MTKLLHFMKHQMEHWNFFFQTINQTISLTIHYQKTAVSFVLFVCFHLVVFFPFFFFFPLSFCFIQNQSFVCHNKGNI